MSTGKTFAMLSNSLLPGQSPGARILGRSLKPVKAGTVRRYCRIVVTVRWAAATEGSRRRNASRVYPGVPLSAPTVCAVAYSTANPPWTTCAPVRFRPTPLIGSDTTLPLPAISLTEPPAPPTPRP